MLLRRKRWLIVEVKVIDWERDGPGQLQKSTLLRKKRPFRFRLIAEVDILEKNEIVDCRKYWRRKQPSWSIPEVNFVEKNETIEVNPRRQCSEKEEKFDALTLADHVKSRLDVLEYRSLIVLSKHVVQLVRRQ